MKRKTILSLLALLLFSAALHAQELPNIADPRVHIKLPTVKGDSLTLASFKGKVILLDFWASFCGPCRVANKGLSRLYSKYKSQGFEIFSVSLDQEKKDWLKAIAKDKMTWTQVNDPRGYDAETAMRWNVMYIPTTYLINKKGDVVAVNPEGRKLEKSIAELLEE